MADIKGINALPCSVFPVRAGKVSAFEYSAAELWMQNVYCSHFLRQHPNPRTALALSAGPSFFHSSYFEYLTKLDDPSLSMALQVILKYLLADFRNPLPQTRVKDFETAYKKGSATPQMLQDLIDLIKRPGGLRKPDILGIVAEREPGRFDLHEVCTVGTLGQTRTELEGKLQQLRDQVIPLAVQEIEARQRELQVSPSDPLLHSFTAEASTWVPPQSLRVCPLGVSFDSAKNAVKVTWACFEPAVDHGTESLVTPGLLPYHIHELYGPMLDAVLPKAVQLDLKRWEGELAKAQGLRLPQLLPEANPAITADLQTLSQHDKLVLSVLVVGVAVVAFCVLAAPAMLAWISALAVPAGVGASSALGAAGADAAAETASVSALVAGVESGVATTEGTYPLVVRYGASLARAAARAAAQAPPPP